MGYIYTLFNKNTPIMDITFDVKRQEIGDIIKIHNPEFAPLGIAVEDKDNFRDNLSDWWESRAVSDTRKHVHWMLSMLQETKQRFLIQSMGLSLSDQYWVKEQGSDVSWKDVNFFTNDFSPVVGEMFFSSASPSGEIGDYTSPDWTLNGTLEKCWRIQDGGRVLCKKGNVVIPQQPYNEKIASLILKKIGNKNFVPYEVGGTLEHPYSVCPNFVTENTEYIPATSLKMFFHKSIDTDMYTHFMKCCDALKITDKMQKYLDYAIPFDYMIGNVDRNMGNFGLIRNVETLKIEKVAPLFDHGNSLWYDSLLPEAQEARAFPFRFKQEEQLPLVCDKSVFPIEKVKGIEEIVAFVLQENPRCCVAGRDERIASLLSERIKRLEDFLDRRKKVKGLGAKSPSRKSKGKKKPNDPADGNGGGPAGGR